MCGIVGLFMKDHSLEPEFGVLFAEMLETMTERGPDSAGFAIYRDGNPDEVKLVLRPTSGVGVSDLRVALEKNVPSIAETVGRYTHLLVRLPRRSLPNLYSYLENFAPEVEVVSSGERMELYKEIGLAADIAREFGLPGMTGTHGVGHTRMATESAVTTDGAHPFTTAPDQCLVHNGSLSNHNNLRRMLVKNGQSFRTKNDSEVAAGYISWRMRGNEGLGQALEHTLDDLDGFFTFVVGTANGFGVLRDPIACKPAVMAQTDQYVAFGSEYRALANLPGISNAEVWEPEPAQVYFWERQHA